MDTPKTSEGAPGRDGPPPARSAEGRPFSLHMIHNGLWKVRGALSAIVSGGDQRSSKQAAAALETVDNLLTRVALEHALGRTVR